MKPEHQNQLKKEEASASHHQSNRGVNSRKKYYVKGNLPITERFMAQLLEVAQILRIEKRRCRYHTAGGPEIQDNHTGGSPDFPTQQSTDDFEDLGEAITQLNIRKA